MKRNIVLAILSLGFFLPFFLNGCNKKGEAESKQESKQASVQMAAAAPNSCGCEASWFPHESTPPPAEGKGSPFDTSSTTNCMFHQWSWQKFLWLTKPTAGGLPLFQNDMIQVNAKLEKIARPASIVVLEDTAQAGSHGSLYTNPNYNPNKKSYVVYYSIFVDNTLLQFADSVKKLLQKDINLLNNNTLTFPIGSLELKASWVDINSIPQNEQSSYYTTKAAIISGKKSTPATVALLGIHVVGRVINHPEFIWATFEHKEMGPYYDWSKTTSQQDAPITSATDMLLFKKGSTQGLGGIKWNKKANRADSLYSIYTLYKYGVPRVAQNAFMGKLSQSEPLNYDNIEGLNMCVAANLNAKDVWRNYFYNGSIWINTDGLSPAAQADTVANLGFNIANVDSGSIARGSLNAFNLTMETYTQVSASNKPNNIHTLNSGNVMNCFTCHNSLTSSNQQSPLYLSHIFSNSLDSTASLSIAKQNGVLRFQRVLKRMKQE